MKRLAPALRILAVGIAFATTPASICAAEVATSASPDADAVWGRVRDAIGQHLGKPYLIGSTGLKSFDCSGFVWRVLTDSGFYLKRTSARKLYLSLRPAADISTSRFGAIVFFDNLRHCGIVNDGDSFCHAECKKGTTVSSLLPYWKGKICGFREFL